MHIVSSRRWRRAGTVVVPGLLVAGALALPPLTHAASAATSHCLVINNAENADYSSLQAAVNAAGSGDTLWVRSVCTGTTEIDRTVTVTGQQPKGFGAPTLDGNGNGAVLLVDPGATLTLNNVTVTHGRSDFGGGVDNQGTLVVNNSSISGNSAGYGAGIYNLTGDSVTLSAGTVVSDNAAWDEGGGVFHRSFGCTDETGALTLNGGRIYDNTAPIGAGVFSDHGTIHLESGSIDSNTANDAGGGIFNEAGTIDGKTSLVRGNTPDDIVTPITC